MEYIFSYGLFDCEYQNIATTCTQNRFERSKPDTSWAKQDRRTSDQAQQDDSYASKLFRTTAPILGKSRLLEPKILSVDRLVDANYQEPSKV